MAGVGFCYLQVQGQDHTASVKKTDARGIWKWEGVKRGCQIYWFWQWQGKKRSRTGSKCCWEGSFFTLAIALLPLSPSFLQMPLAWLSWVCRERNSFCSTTCWTKRYESYNCYRMLQWLRTLVFPSIFMKEKSLKYCWRHLGMSFSPRTVGWWQIVLG